LPRLGGEWQVRPSAFELLESGQLDDDEPRFDDFPAALPSSRFGPVSGTELRSAWRSVLKHLRGYTPGRQLVDWQTVWVPIIDLPAPPEGRSVFRYTTGSARRVTPSISVFGVGLGAKAEHTFTASFEFEADKLGKQYLISLDLRMTEWLSRTDPPVPTIDFRVPAEGVNTSVANLPADGDDPAVTGVWTPDQWIEIRRVELSRATPPGMETRRLAVARTCTWTPGLHTPVLTGLAGLELGLGAEVEHSDSFDLSFELPYGHDYVFYRRASEVPLVPHCSIVGRW
jgi:hypothetical protein